MEINKDNSMAKKIVGKGKLVKQVEDFIIKELTMPEFVYSNDNGIITVKVHPRSALDRMPKYNKMSKNKYRLFSKRMLKILNLQPNSVITIDTKNCKITTSEGHNLRYEPYEDIYHAYVVSNESGNSFIVKISMLQSHVFYELYTKNLKPLSCHTVRCISNEGLEFGMCNNIEGALDSKLVMDVNEGGYVSEERYYGQDGSLQYHYKYLYNSNTEEDCVDILILDELEKDESAKTDISAN